MYHTWTVIKAKNLSVAPVGLQEIMFTQFAFYILHPFVCTKILYNEFQTFRPKIHIFSH